MPHLFTVYSVKPSQIRPERSTVSESVRKHRRRSEHHCASCSHRAFPSGGGRVAGSNPVSPTDPGPDLLRRQGPVSCPDASRRDHAMDQLRTRPRERAPCSSVTGCGGPAGRAVHVRTSIAPRDQHCEGFLPHPQPRVCPMDPLCAAVALEPLGAAGGQSRQQTPARG